MSVVKRKVGQETSLETCLTVDQWKMILALSLEATDISRKYAKDTVIGGFPRGELRPYNALTQVYGDDQTIMAKFGEVIKQLQVVDNKIETISSNIRDLERGAIVAYPQYVDRVRLSKRHSGEFASARLPRLSFPRRLSTNSIELFGTHGDSIYYTYKPNMYVWRNIATQSFLDVQHAMVHLKWQHFVLAVHRRDIDIPRELLFLLKTFLFTTK
jgi:hypothetical protein